MNRPAPETRDRYRHFLTIPTRWMDNDAYGHVNNVTYYSYFDTVVNQLLIARGVLDVEKSETIGLVVETHCNFLAPITFPETVHAGLRVAKIGNSSVRYEIGLFREDDLTAAAHGHFVHVYVHRHTRQSATVPGPVRELLSTLLAEERR
jgi:acyl-CoA thioester hydrolase